MVMNIGSLLTGMVSPASGGAARPALDGFASLLESLLAQPREGWLADLAEAIPTPHTGGDIIEPSGPGPEARPLGDLATALLSLLSQPEPNAEEDAPATGSDPTRQPNVPEGGDADRLAVVLALLAVATPPAPSTQAPATTPEFGLPAEAADPTPVPPAGRTDVPDATLRAQSTPYLPAEPEGFDVPAVPPAEGTEVPSTGEPIAPRREVAVPIPVAAPAVTTSRIVITAPTPSRPAADSRPAPVDARPAPVNALPAAPPPDPLAAGVATAADVVPTPPPVARPVVRPVEPSSPKAASIPPPIVTVPAIAASAAPAGPDASQPPPVVAPERERPDPTAKVASADVHPEPAHRDEAALPTPRPAEPIATGETVIQATPRRDPAPTGATPEPHPRPTPPETASLPAAPDPEPTASAPRSAGTPVPDAPVGPVDPLSHPDTEGIPATARRNDGPRAAPAEVSSAPRGEPQMVVPGPSVPPPVAAPPAPAAIDPPAPVTRVLEHVQEMLQVGQTRLRVRLEPEWLGPVEVRVVARPGGLEIELVARSPEARGLLERDLGWLQAGLVESGHEVQRVQVTAPEATATDTFGGTADQRGDLNWEGQGDVDWRQSFRLYRLDQPTAQVGAEHAVVEAPRSQAHGVDVRI